MVGSQSVFLWRLQAEEAQEQYKASVADLEARKVGLSNAKSEILAQIRKLVFQCDLTLKAVCIPPFDTITIFIQYTTSFKADDFIIVH